MQFLLLYVTALVVSCISVKYKIVILDQAQAKLSNSCHV